MAQTSVLLHVHDLSNHDNGEADAVRDIGNQSTIPKNATEFMEWDLSTVDLNDLDNWVPKQVAASLLGISDRQLERDSAPPMPKIEKRLRHLPGGGRRPMPVYSPRDIQVRLKASLRPTFMMQKPEPPPPPTMQVELVERFATAIARLQPPPAEPDPPLFMDLETACVVARIRVELRGSFQRLLRQAIRKGLLRAHQVGKNYFIHRDDLFNFHPAQPTVVSDPDDIT